jgi:hypothetical protein
MGSETLTEGDTEIATPIGGAQKPVESFEAVRPSLLWQINKTVDCGSLLRSRRFTNLGEFGAGDEVT